MNCYDNLDSTKCKDLAKYLDSAKGVKVSERRDAGGLLSSSPRSDTSELVDGCKIVASGAVLNTLSAKARSPAVWLGTEALFQQLSKEERETSWNDKQNEVHIEQSSQVSMDAEVYHTFFGFLLSRCFRFALLLASAALLPKVVQLWCMILTAKVVNEEDC